MDGVMGHLLEGQEDVAVHGIYKELSGSHEKIVQKVWQMEDVA